MVSTLYLLGLATLSLAIPTKRGLIFNGGDGSDTGELEADMAALAHGDTSQFSDVEIPHGGALQPADTLIIHGFTAGDDTLKDEGLPDPLKEGGTADQLEDQADGDTNRRAVAERGLPIATSGVVVTLSTIVTQAEEGDYVTMPQYLITQARTALQQVTVAGAGGDDGLGGGLVPTGGLPAGLGAGTINVSAAKIVLQDIASQATVSPSNEIRLTRTLIQRGTAVLDITGNGGVGGIDRLGGIAGGDGEGSIGGIGGIGSS